MSKQLQQGSAFVHRSTILDGLQALNLAQDGFGDILQSESYACGYSDGYANALRSVAQLLGVLDEFTKTTQKQNTSKLSYMLRVQDISAP